MARQLLLIEDSATDARLVRAALQDAREPACDVEHAADLQSGLRRLAAPGIDLVLLDLHLPESRGLATLQRLQEAHPNVPVIVVTGSDDVRLADLAIDQGAQDLVVKGTPHFVPVLRHSIRAALERIQVLEALHAALGTEAAPLARSRRDRKAAR
ncbi:MAG: response regulator [Thermoplasmatota archaeon]